MAHLHASLEITCKSGISKISTRCQKQEGRGQSSFNMSRLNQNWKILGDILVSQIGGCQSSFNFWSWTQKCKFCIDIFYGVSCNIKCITAISNLHLQEKIVLTLTFSNGYQLMGKRFMAHLHSKLTSLLMGKRFRHLHTCKSGISKISTRFQNQGGLIIFQLLILNSEMEVLHWYLLWSFLQYYLHYSHFKSAFTRENTVN